MTALKKVSHLPAETLVLAIRPFATILLAAILSGRGSPDTQRAFPTFHGSEVTLFVPHRCSK